MANCNQCNKVNSKCSCKTPPANCKPKCCPDGVFNTDCIEYNQIPNKSRLLCFLGINNKVTLTKVLEVLDSKLCLKPSECAKLKFGLGCDVGIDIAVQKILDYVCQLDDTKVKVSRTDKTNGYLFDKVETGDCLKKVIKQDMNGNQTLSIELDFACIETRLSCCGGGNTVINISGVNSICGNNTTILTASTNCSGTIIWSNGMSGPTIQASAGQYFATCSGVQSNVITVVNTGSCNCVDSSWNFTSAERCQAGTSQLEQISNCGNYRWINGGDACQVNPCVSYKFSNITNQAVTLTYQCGGFQQVLIPALGCIVVMTEIGEWQYPANTLLPEVGGSCTQGSFSKVRTQNFTKSCTNGCTGSVIPYSQTYYSNVSQLDADTIAANDSNFNTAGQNNANSNGICTGLNCNGCTPTTWTNNGNTRCELGVSQIEQTSNCNTTQWINGGTACSNACTIPSTVTVNGSTTPTTGVASTYSYSQSGGNNNTWSYLWSSSNTNDIISTPVGASTNIIFSSNASRVITLRICCGITCTTKTITVVPTTVCPVITTSLVESFCNLQNTLKQVTVNIINGQAPYTVTIKATNGNIINTPYTGFSSGSQIQVPNGTYNIEVKDNNNCLAALVPINVNCAISCPTITVGGSVSSNTVTATASGGLAPYSYTIDGINNPNNTTGASSGVFTGLANGVYTVTVMDSTAASPRCLASRNFTVCNSFQATLVQGACNSTGTGKQSTVNVSGGSGTYTVTLYATGNNNFITSNTVTSSSVPIFIPNGSYYITIGDSDGCGASNITGIEVNCVTCNVVSSYNSSCASSGIGVNGTISISSGQSPFTTTVRNASNAVVQTVSYSNNSFGLNILEANGNYTITTTDVNNCVSNVIPLTINCNTTQCEWYTVLLNKTVNYTNCSGTSTSISNTGTGSGCHFQASLITSGTLNTDYVFGQGICETSGGGCPTITFSNNTPGQAIVGTNYTLNAEATTTSGTLTYSISPSLPPGLSLDSNTGIITGTPTNALNTVSYTVTAQTSTSCSETKNYSFSVSEPSTSCSGITIDITPTNSSTIQWTQSTAISNINLGSIGGSGGYIYSVSGLPTGITINLGVITGTPTSIGVGSFTITSTDSNGCIGQKVYNYNITGTVQNNSVRLIPCLNTGSHIFHNNIASLSAILGSVININNTCYSVDSLDSATANNTQAFTVYTDCPACNNDIPHNVYTLSNCDGGFGNVLTQGHTNLSVNTVVKVNDGTCYTITGSFFDLTTSETKLITESFAPGGCSECQGEVHYQLINIVNNNNTPVTVNVSHQLGVPGVTSPVIPANSSQTFCVFVGSTDLPGTNMAIIEDDSSALPIFVGNMALGSGKYGTVNNITSSFLSYC